jgi:hypothetical protein
MLQQIVYLMKLNDRAKGVGQAVNYVSKRDAILFITDPIGQIVGAFLKK